MIDIRLIKYFILEDNSVQKNWLTRNMSILFLKWESFDFLFKFRRTFIWDIAIWIKVSLDPQSKHVRGKAGCDFYFSFCRTPLFSFYFKHDHGERDTSETAKKLQKQTTLFRACKKMDPGTSRLVFSTILFAPIKPEFTQRLKMQWPKTLVINKR